MDHAEIKDNVQKQETWLRGLFALLFIIIASLAETLILMISIFQFGHILLTQSINQPLLLFSKSLSRYVYHITMYVCFSTEEKPFPIGEWPKPKSLDD